MDEAAAASTSEAEVKEDPFSGGSASENATRGSSKTTTQSVGDFCCHDCGDAFREEAAYLEHCKLHTQENLGLNIGNHLDSLPDSTKDGDTTNVCNLCSLSFVELSEFHSHMEKLHGQTSQNESSIQMDSGPKKQHTYECPDCGKIYGMLGHLLNHQRSHMQPSKSLFFRNLEHLEKKAFQCETCGRNYSRASALDAHRRCHEEKLIKSRNRSSEDSSHTETRPSENQTADTPEKLFKCSCGKAFSASMRLKTHQRFSRNSQCTREEMKEKPRRGVTDFYCSDCDKYFNGHLAFINHQRWHANRSEDPKRFLCEECGKEFMTLTFYYRHQRMVHATPAKSFLQQVCELQKKAFECQTCGLKFSRASALQSHQLQHTDAFSETEKILPLQTSLLPQQKVFDRDREETEPLEEAESRVLPGMSEVSFENDSDEDMDSYELGDFNVQVISASESEDESTQDTNPDLELVCESDQEGREDGETVIATSCLVSKTDMDLKIVQIDLEPAEEQTALVATDAESHTEKRFDCPQCYRWFTSKASLGVHKMWHGIRKKRQQLTGQSVTAYTCDTSYYESNSFASHCDHIKEQKGTDRNNDVLKTEGELVKNPLSCDDCGKCFTRLSALVSHQSNHPKRKPFQCPDCIMSFSHEATLFTHMNHCSAQKKENVSVTKKQYNPTKTLLGPKIYHCEQCGKGFWSLGAFSHHKQSPNQCADSRLRKGVAGSLNSVNGGPRSSIKVACPVCGRKFRHKGIMTLHMRKHENGNHKCELCDRSFRLFSSLVRHQVVHSDQLLPPPIKSFQHQVEQLKKNTYSCPDCGKLFSRAKALQFHMKSHGYETGHSPSSPRSSVTLEELQCATCLAYFNSKASLRAHQKLCVKKDLQIVQYKTENLENCNTVKSPVDSIGIPSQEMNSIDVDIEKDTDVVQMGQSTVGIVENTDATDLKYKCKRCNRSFSVIGALNLHKRIHTKGHKSLAKAKSAMSRALKEPKEEELSQELFDCSECGMGFMSSSALDAHKRLHSERTFSQSLLKEQFFNPYTLKDRLTTDIKVEPDSTLDHAGFSCPECNKTFMESALLSAHYDDEHSQILPAAYLQGDERTSKSVEQVPQELAIISNESESNSSALRPKTHQCPLCSLAFAKARGLNAHKWQVHFKITKDKIKFPLHLGSINTEESSAVGKKNCSVERGQQSVRMETFPLKFITCLECGKQCRNAVALLDHRKVCSFIKQESKLEVQTPEASAEVSSQLGHLPEHSAKYLFKCGDCGKAFQTEEQLGAHKTKAKSRPYCCALCCHGFWTENQLQQHLAWHDEVRCRLPSEVRFRLSAAMTTKSLKSNLPSTDNRASSFASSSLGQPEHHPESQLQSSHKCQHCGKAFLSPAALQNHQTLYCNNDSYHCTICSRTFSEIQDLIDHHQECISDYKQQNDGPTAASD